MNQRMALARQPGRGDLIGGKYRLARRLGVGGMGEVWVARNRDTRADVAVKLCHPDSAAHHDTMARFRQEARLGAMLSHRSVVRIYDLVEESNGTLILVMELLRGETLERYLTAHGPLPCAEALAIVLPVLSALAHAHELGVVHRDITPANIFLAVDPDGQVIPKIVDFGIAKVPGSGHQTIDGRALGTPRYMSPEQIRAQRDIDGRSDLFSVAAVFYEMVTGSSPFEANTASAALAAVLEAVVDPDPGFEPRVWLELQRALSKRPYERHASATEMANALRAAVGTSDEDLSRLLRRARPESPSTSRDRSATLMTKTMGGHSVGPSREARRARASWVVAAVLGACVAIGATAAMLHARARPAAPPAPVHAERAEPAPPSPVVALSKTATSGPPPTPPREPSVAVVDVDAPPPKSPAATATAAPAPAPAAPARPPHPKRARPVATTPGF